MKLLNLIGKRHFTENIILLEKLRDQRGNKLNMRLRNIDNIKFQTLWSDFTHICLYNNSSKIMKAEAECDITNIADISNIVFQNNELFDKKIGSIEDLFILTKVKQKDVIHNYFASQINHKVDNLIIRIPEEQNLSIDTDCCNMEINNPEYTKLSSLEEVTFNLTGGEDLNPLIFKAKKIQSNKLSITLMNSTVMTMTTVETSILDFISNGVLNMRIKKLGITENGYLLFKSLTYCSISSLYSKGLVIDHSGEYLRLEVSTIQIENTLKIKSNNGILIIDNLEANSFDIESNAEEIRLFIKSINNNSTITILNPNANVLIFTDEENSNILLNINNENKIDESKTYVNITANESTKGNIKYEQISSWNYLKKRIENKNKSWK